MEAILIALLWVCIIMIVVSVLPLPASIRGNQWVRLMFVLVMVLLFLIKSGLTAHM